MSQGLVGPGALLRARGVTRRFGGLLAVDAVDVDVPPGQVRALIGPNGAGKTTLFNCLTGMLTPDAGTVELGGTDLTRLSPDARARAGLGRTFQRLEVFAGLSVFDNVLVAAEVADRGSVLRGLWALRHREPPGLRATVWAILDHLGLVGVADARAGELPTGVLRLVELARALAARPRVLLLDEPGSGLDAAETARLQAVVADLAGQGLGILLVEHDVELVMAVSEHIYVMDFGRLVAQGTPEEIRVSPVVREAYLGAPAPGGQG